MPRKDGTGPYGQGNSGGRRTDAGGGRMGGQYAAGPSGVCKCPKCGAESPHNAGTPCTSVSCPKCGAKMVRG